MLEGEGEEELPVAVDPPHWVQVLPETAIEGEGVEGGVQLTHTAEVSWREVGEYLEEDLWREVQEALGGSRDV